MSPEFSPKAPKAVPTEIRGRNSGVVLKGTFLKYKEIASTIYDEALFIAESIDDKIETTVPFNRNAVSAAFLLSIAAVRGAQIS